MTKNILRFFLFSALHVIFAPLINAQNPEWLHFISGSDVRAIVEEDKNLWVGGIGSSLRKINKETGLVTLYTSQNSPLPNNYITCLATDKRGNKWIGTDTGGIVKYDGQFWTNYTPDNSGLTGSWIRDVIVDKNDVIWMATSHAGVNTFDGTNWTSYSIENSELPSIWVESLAIDKHDNIWIGTAIWMEEYGLGGLAKFDGTTWTVYDTSNSELPSNEVFCVAVDKNDNKWIASGKWLSKFDGVTWKTYNSENSILRDNLIFTVAVDSNNNKWFGTFGNGVVKLDSAENTWSVYNTKNSNISHDFILKIYIDGTGDKWIGTFGGGLNKFDDKKWSEINTGNCDLLNNNIRAFTFDEQGNTWVGTLRGLAKFDGEKWTAFFRKNSGLPSDTVRAITIDAENNKWIATWNGGIAKFDDINWTVYNPKNSPLPTETISTLAIDMYGNKWIGTWGHGLTKFDGHRWTIYTKENSGLVNNYITAIQTDFRGHVWTGTYSGLAKFDMNEWTTVIDDSYVSDIELDSFGILWVALDGTSLVRIDSIHQKISVNDGISKFVIDSENNKWIASQASLLKLDSEGNEIAWFTTGNSKISIGPVRALDIDAKGNIWIGYDWDGVSVYREGGVILTEATPYKPQLPLAPLLHQNYPNPFNGHTTLSFHIQKPSFITISIYNIAGKEIKSLIKSYSERGVFQTVWDGTDDHNNRVASGVYFYRMTAGVDAITKKMILMQ